MKAKAIIEKYIKKSMRGKVGVIAMKTVKDNPAYWYWWHIDEDEELPKEEKREFAILLPE